MPFGDQMTKFNDQLDTVSDALDASLVDGSAVQSALWGLHSIGIPLEMDITHLERYFDVCYRALEFAQGVDAAQGGDALLYYAQQLIEGVFIDAKASNRPYAQSNLHRTTAFQTKDGANTGLPAPYPHMALTRLQAADLAAPYFRFLETELETIPTAHFKLCWSVRQYPLMPFARVLNCLLYTSPSPRDQRGSRMPSSA